jgi:hypothetical protein
MMLAIVAAVVLVVWGLNRVTAPTSVIGQNLGRRS